MNVLLLDPNRPDLVYFLQSCNDRVTNTEEKLLADSDFFQNIEFIISYGYRHIFKKEILDKFPVKQLMFIFPYYIGIEAPILIYGAF